MLDLVGRRYIWFAISLLLIIPGLIFLLMPGGGLRRGIDFSGGTLWEFSIPNRTTPITPGEIDSIFHQQELEARSQVSPPNDEQQVVVAVRTPEVKTEDPKKQAVTTAVQQAFPNAELTRFETVGATVSRESTRQAIVAVFAASLAILGYLTFAFRKAPHPVRYGVCAIIAMLHDVLLVLGVAAILGYFIGLEVDALFLTALLTVISFSVHDTIVVFDRIRENFIRHPGDSFEDVVNHSLTQTLARSLNTSLTVLLVLLALLLFGGVTIRNFVLALLIGITAGTYSSIFFASMLLVSWQRGELARLWPFKRRPTLRPAAAR